MLEEFLKGLPDSDAALRAAHLDADYDALYYVVHRLAGATPVVGATALHASASELQNYMRLDPRPLERIDMGVARLLREIARFRVSVTV
jgi:HPt (histidine-containing phosphotransfer) domain-containing protein